MKISLITTCKNEEMVIKELLDSVIQQTVKPDEFIIVDGGSKDKTVEIIKKYQKNYKWIKLIVSKGASIGRGRNIAIKKAKNDFIAVTDAGCTLDKNWLKNIKKFLEKFDIVYGWCKSKVTDSFTHCFDLIVCNKFGIHYNVAFNKKEIKIKYEDWNTSEDTAWNFAAKQRYKNIGYASNAIVYWDGCKNYKELWNKFVKYGNGDKKIMNLLSLGHKLLVYFFPLVFPFVLLEGLFWLIKCKSIHGFGIQVVRRIAYAYGALK